MRQNRFVLESHRGRYLLTAVSLGVPPDYWLDSLTKPIMHIWQSEITKLNADGCAQQLNTYSWKTSLFAYTPPWLLDSVHKFRSSTAGGRRKRSSYAVNFQRLPQNLDKAIFVTNFALACPVNSITITSASERTRVCSERAFFLQGPSSCLDLVHFVLNSAGPISVTYRNDATHGQTCKI